jgi:hypothetical protein
MADDPDYISLSKRFESFAERAVDPVLAEAYRKLAQTYRALDFWHQRFRHRYEQSVARGALDGPGGRNSDLDKSDSEQN